MEFNHARRSSLSDIFERAYSADDANILGGSLGGISGSRRANNNNSAGGSLGGIGGDRSRRSNLMTNSHTINEDHETILHDIIVMMGRKQD